MLADTSAIHAFGVAQTRHAADLAAITARLTAAGECRSDALGPVGGRFLAALTEAMTEQVRLVAGLGQRIAAAATDAHSTANAYSTSERRTGQSLSGLGA
jgi:hypothetical protein